MSGDRLPGGWLRLIPGWAGTERRQVAGILRMEVRRYLCRREAITVYILACLPILFVIGTDIALLISSHWQFQESFDLFGKTVTAARQEGLFARTFKFVMLRFVLFFISLHIFGNLFKGEEAEKTLHLYFLCPVRRGVIVLGKYLSGIIVGSLAGSVSAVLTFALLYLPHGFRAFARALVWEPGLHHLAPYLLTVVLATMAYGALFLLLGSILKNPVIAGAIFYCWELASIAMPRSIKLFMLNYYLDSLLPLRVLSDKPFAVLTDPAPAWRAVLTLLAVCVVFFAAAVGFVRRKEINYTTET
jgi:ABC-type transport system involved in multi-copper enzyme maturation permease subunit